MAVLDIKEKLSGFRRKREEESTEENPKVIRLRRIEEEQEEEAKKFLFLPADETTTKLLITLLIALVAAVLGFWFYNRVHTYDEYAIKTSIEKNDIDGTGYLMLGNSLLKYSPDGVFCVDLQNHTKWSTAYSMQTPICARCKNTVVIAEQQGQQVYLFQADGEVGHFETTLPIRQACVAANGVVALVLQDQDTAWIMLYGSDGSQIASVKASMDISGYPMNVAITDNAKKMAVSYLCLAEGDLTGRIVFYDFSSASDNDEAHQTGSADFAREVFPRIYFADRSTLVAVGDCSMEIFHDTRKPADRTSVAFDREIVSFFCDEYNEGFIFRSQDSQQLYDMEVYNIRGKRVMQTSFGFEYTGVRMENAEILLYDAVNLYAYRTSGKQKLSLTYEKPVEYFALLSGYHRYLVITEETMDQIRIM
ncbi:MAG: hypothetical protein IJI24_08200 [Lachnospiraceae bacterium]|nr:hypothetical protein [Lachnospiraceae bacterium]